MAQQVTAYEQMADDMNVVLAMWWTIDPTKRHLREGATARLKAAGLRFDADRTTFKVIS